MMGRLWRIPKLGVFGAALHPDHRMTMDWG
jgi:hypothetical protein